VRGRARGNGKTELAAAIACVEFLGPARCSGFDDKGKPIPIKVSSPDIPVAAGSFEQADLLFGAARTMIAQGPLAPFCEVYDTEILQRHGPGRMYRVAAVAGTNEGLRPTFAVKDETHEWVGPKKRVHIVIGSGLAKRHDSWELDITTAGAQGQDSVAEDSYRYGRAVADGAIEDDAFLFDWLEASTDLDISEPDQLEEAVRAANPAVGAFLPLDNLVRRYHEIPEMEFRRYHLNQWVLPQQRWMAPETWEARAERSRVEPPHGAEIILGFDGSYKGDSTALVGCTLDGHIFVIDAWEKPAGDDDWVVDILDVEEAIRHACRRWKVRECACDPYRWQRTMAVLADEGIPIVEWPTNSVKRMVPACAKFYDAVMGERLTHDGDERLARHVGNCILKVDSMGPRITKDHKDSPRKIDLAVAAVIAHDRATQYRSEAEPNIRILDAASA
jgi:phage terminase large subunit-like protein